VTAEALISLRSRIEKNAHMLDKSSKHCLQKLAKAAEKAFAERTLLVDKNRLLFEQNNERYIGEYARFFRVYWHMLYLERGPFISWSHVYFQAFTLSLY
jgi:hypothetical protein